jgi:hypothetical protein
MAAPEDRGPILAPSTVLQNRYRILRLHDQGGSAAVYLAERLGVEEPVPMAVKELNPGVFGLAEFKNEVNVLYSLNHPNLPKVYDFFEQDGKHYLVMDFVQGITLKQRVLDAGPFPVDQALDIAVQVGDILRYLHERVDRKIIHRDLKPSNLMLTKSGQVKLLDFGIARVPESQLPGNHLYAYTEDYAAPEQKANQKADERSDVYSFGVTLHFLLTGTTPAEAIEAASSVKLSREVRRILGRCLKSNPADRYQSFTELSRDLQAYREARHTRTTRVFWAVTAGVGLVALFVAGKMLLHPLYPIVGPERVAAGESVALEVGLPGGWSGSLEGIVWQVADIQAGGAPKDVQRGRYFNFRATDLGAYQVQASLETAGRRRPLSDVKRIEVYPVLDLPAELPVHAPLTLRCPSITAAGGRTYTWTWDVRGPVVGDNVSAAPSKLQVSTKTPVQRVALGETGRYVATVAVTVRTPNGPEVTLSAAAKTVDIVDQVVVDPLRVRNENPGFEEEYGGQPVAWVVVYPAYLAYDKTQGHTGSRSLRFDARTGTPPSYAVQLVPLTGGKSYRVTVWVKGQGLSPGSSVFTLEGRFRSSSDETYVLPDEVCAFKPEVASLDWTQVMIYFSIPAGSPANLEIYVRYSGPGTLWLDDCAVEALN